MTSLQNTLFGLLIIFLTINAVLCENNDRISDLENDNTLTGKTKVTVNINVNVMNKCFISILKQFIRLQICGIKYSVLST